MRYFTPSASLADVGVVSPDGLVLENLQLRVQSLQLRLKHCQHFESSLFLNFSLQRERVASHNSLRKRNNPRRFSKKILTVAKM